MYVGVCCCHLSHLFSASVPADKRERYVRIHIIHTLADFVFFYFRIS